uniref:Uncharacterized protein n=1 Tax=Candidatus Kentrum sp. TUN TaxID=2126343 RepID=A0A450ZFH8_9GAMM|nr:MAG: hypothetical protein BECKTUN1418D_GA0071000_100518 [Candidatus Kentron sp. TUN]VFK52519.1 MAG: hypothetical protein BECKTUN1418F_GA0071002_100918 [Candidatus Kentron sp. TUN]VFK52839.1 MAG: hypothetical protein BECKTUN1418E_GA0071001_101018 [Candidatus Kentron sp. TUN]
METWEQILIGAAAILILLWFFPSTKRAVEESPKGTKEDWLALIKPIVMVIVFIIFLIFIARG